MFGGKVIFIKKILMLALTGVAQLVGQLSCKAEGGRLDSWSGLVPGLRVPSPVRAHTAHRCFFPLWLPPFPSLEKKINEQTFKNKKNVL